MTKRKPASASPGDSGQFAYQGLERSIHEKARLGIMTSLLTHREGVSFNDLKRLCDLTDGNLSRHLEVLQNEGFVSISKQTDRRSHTLCRLTPAGRKRFLEYLEELQRVIADVEVAAKPAASAIRLSPSP